MGRGRKGGLEGEIAQEQVVASEESQGDVVDGVVQLQGCKREGMCLLWRERGQRVQTSQQDEGREQTDCHDRLHRRRHGVEEDGQEIDAVIDGLEQLVKQQHKDEAESHNEQEERVACPESGLVGDDVVECGSVDGVEQAEIGDQERVDFSGDEDPEVAGARDAPPSFG
jgi:hypothetical protein